GEADGAGVADLGSREFANHVGGGHVEGADTEELFDFRLADAVDAGYDGGDDAAAGLEEDGLADLVDGDAEEFRERAGADDAWAKDCFADAGLGSLRPFGGSGDGGLRGRAVAALVAGEDGTGGEAGLDDPLGGLGIIAGDEGERGDAELVEDSGVGQRIDGA